MMFSVLIASLTIGFAVLAWRDLRRALTLLFALLPTYLVRFSLGPLPTTLLEVFVLTIIAVWMMKHRGIKTDLQSLERWRAPLLLLLAAACFAASHAPDIFAGLGILKAYYLEPVLLVIITKTTFRSPDDWRRAYIALTISGVLVSVVAIVQYATGLGIPSPWDTERRVTSVFDFPNAVGLFLAPIVSVLIVWLVGQKPADRRVIVPVLAVVLMLAAIVLAQTEAAIAAIPAALLLTLLISRSQRRWKIVGTALFVVTLAAALAAPPIRTKLLLQDVSGQARVMMWQETAHYLADGHWLLGAGLSGFPSAIAPYHDTSFYEIFQYPHNILLNIWVELGLLGVITAVLIASNAARAAWQRRNDVMTLCAFAALATMIIHGLVDVPFFKNDLAMMTAGFVAFLM